MTQYLIKGETLIGIADAIRSKTGGTESIPTTEMAAQIEGISGGGVTQKDLLPETTYDDFFMSEAFGAIIHSSLDTYALTVGKTYKVVWDGQTYTCVAQDASAVFPSYVVLGNAVPIGLAGNGEPFMIAVNMSEAVYVPLTDTEPGSSHAVRVYQEVGSGSSADLRYVTFMDHTGTVELGKKAVAVGDDCADPIVRGVFDTPTRESDAQYDYTHIGWANTPGGGWDETALKSITEDKTVYAAYAATVRSYTITFYDSDGTTVLKTMAVAYGSTPSYTPTKENFMFNGWSPTVTAVVGDASYRANWIEKASFATSSWDKIIATAQSGNAASSFSVGDERTETIVVDGVAESVTYVVAGFGVSTLADGTTKDNMTIITKHALSKLRAMHSTYAGASYYNTDLAKWLHGTLVLALPEVLQNGIKEKYIYKNGSTVISHKCWLLSSKEVALATASYYNDYETYSKQLPLFTNDASRIKTQGASGAAVSWWTRAFTWEGSNAKYANISTAGKAPANSYAMSSPNGTSGVVFGFCI